MSPKEIAERVLEIKERGKFEHINFGDHQFKESASVELARAYLELEEKHEYVHKKLLDDIEYQKKEITKLKKSREVLRNACEFYGDKEKWSGYSHYQTEMMHEDDHEFTKEIHYISNCDCESNCRCEPIDSGKCNVYGGKKAREAIKADDEIMGSDDCVCGEINARNCPVHQNVGES